MDLEVISIQNVLFHFLKEKFPNQTVEHICYEGGAQPGDYKAPYFAINDAIVGYLINNFKDFIPYSAANAKDQYKVININQPNFLDIFHKMAIYELGYDPMKPGSREAYMSCSPKEWEEFHPELSEIYHTLQ